MSASGPVQPASSKAERTLSEVVTASGARKPFSIGVAGVIGVAAVGAGLLWQSPTAQGHVVDRRGVERAAAPRLDLSEFERARSKGCLHPELGCAQIAPPAAPQAASEPEPAAPSPEMLEAALALARERELERQEAEARLRARQEERRRSPMTVYSGDDPSAAPAVSVSIPEDASAVLPAIVRNANAPGSREEALLRRAELPPVEPVRAQRISNPETTVAEGTLIRAVLETGIQSDLPGMVRAQVSDPVYSFGGAMVVPRGSLLIGRYESGLVRAQTRVFVVWTRLLRPDGVSMQLASPATDELGGSGVPGKVNTHFFQRFGSSLLLSLVDGGLGIAAARAQGDGATIVNAGGREFQGAAELALENSVNIPPTIQVPRGTPVQVFVARDLDFAEPIVRESAAVVLP